MNSGIERRLRLFSVITLAIVLSIAALSFTVRRAEAAEVIFTVNPPLSTAKVGSTFTVRIYVIDADYIYSWQVYMSWTTALTFSSHTFGGFLTDQPEGSTTSTRVEPTWFMISEATGGAYLGKSAAGWNLLLTVRFLVNTATATDLVITNDFTYFMKCTVVPTLVKTYPIRENGGFIPAWAEDFNVDGWVDIFDISTVAIQYGKTGSPGWIPEDLYEDGVIDIADLSMVAIKFGEHYAN